MDANHGLYILNVSNPASPSYIGRFNTHGNALGIFVSGSYAYVADGGDGLQRIDVFDPENPSLAGSYNTPTEARKTFVSGSYAYVANRYSLIILSSNPSTDVEDNLIIPNKFLPPAELPQPLQRLYHHQLQPAETDRYTDRGL